ncbi:potassium channel family protein [Saccharicrinis sp. FJH2]|uniref:potassium channel family protein n=1 Tax=unclassified Saccharicrinis TaxID=2646859 RepID=UPI0035D473BF
MFFLIRHIIDFLKIKPYRNLTIATFTVLLNGTFIYHFVEHWKWLDSLYFSVMTLTTVGYGDFVPQTAFGKIFTMVYVLTGIGIIFGFINSFYQHRTNKMKEVAEKRSKNNLKK